MRKNLLAIAALALFAASACGKGEDTAAVAAPVAAPVAAHDQAIRTVSVDRLSGWRSDAKVKVAVFDANGPGTRSDIGMIPNAVALKDYQHCAGELPQDKDQKLVFYCYNEMCGASHAAAEVAVAEGFEDVSVLTAGIMGWKEAGKPLQKL